MEEISFTDECFWNSSVYNFKFVIVLPYCCIIWFTSVTLAKFVLGEWHWTSFCSCRYIVMARREEIIHVFSCFVSIVLLVFCTWRNFYIISSSTSFVYHCRPLWIWAHTTKHVSMLMKSYLGIRCLKLQF